MTVTANIQAHEVIGLGAKIIDSSDPALNGTSGTIVFETKNTISMSWLIDFIGVNFRKGPALLKNVFQRPLKEPLMNQTDF